MSPATLILLALGLGLSGWLAARARARAFRRASPERKIASLPSYHGWYVAAWVTIPTLLFLAVWNIIAPQLVLGSVLADPAAANLPEFGFQRDRMLGEARAVAAGGATAVFNPGAQPLIGPFREAIGRYQTIGLVLTFLIAFSGGAWAFLRLKPDFAARSKVERMVMGSLLLASLAAILTTLGIFASLVFETIRFFGMVSPIDFLFGTHWSPDPMGDPANVDPSRYGAIPLFWGTI